MRTTVNIDDDLLAQVKRLALESNSSLGAVLEDAIRVYMGRREEPAADFVWSDVAMQVPGGRGMRPGINWRSNSAMLDLMDES